VLRVALREGLAVGQLEVGELEARGDRAANEGVGRSGGEHGAEPGAGRHHDLPALPRIGIGTQGEVPPLAVGVDRRDQEGAARVEVPHLVGLDPVERRDLAGAQQVVDGRRGRAGPPVAGREVGAVDALG
jgi:hypothetical protein